MIPDRPYVEQLTPLELPIPRSYIRAYLVFQTTKPISAVAQSLQCGLDKLSKQLPWLSGRVCSTSSSQGSGDNNSAFLEIRSDVSDTPPTLINKGSIDASYEDLASRGIPVDTIPSDVCPVSGMIDQALFPRGEPVFAAGLFSFADQRGVGLCVCLHHSVVDGTGLTDVMRLWARNVANENGHSIADTDRCLSTSPRLERLSGALSHELHEAASLSFDELLNRCPQVTKIPPAVSTDASPPPCTSKLFTIPIHRINALKELLREHTLNGNVPTTNTILSALVWSTVTRIRSHHTPSSRGQEQEGKEIEKREEISILSTVVNLRTRINPSNPTLSDPEAPYFGNLAETALTKISPTALSAASAIEDKKAIPMLAQICDAIAHAQSPALINAQSIAEKYLLVERSYREDIPLFPGWDLFGPRDLTISSWASFDLYGVDFGAACGKPTFVRLADSGFDGVVVFLPRKRAAGDGERVEVVFMLRRDHMVRLENDGVWRRLTSL